MELSGQGQFLFRGNATDSHVRPFVMRTHFINESFPRKRESSDVHAPVNDTGPPRSRGRQGIDEMSSRNMQGQDMQGLDINAKPLMSPAHSPLQRMQSSAGAVALPSLSYDFLIAGKKAVLTLSTKKIRDLIPQFLGASLWITPRPIV